MFARVLSRVAAGQVVTAAAAPAARRTPSSAISATGKTTSAVAPRRLFAKAHAAAAAPKAEKKEDAQLEAYIDEEYGHVTGLEREEIRTMLRNEKFGGDKVLLGAFGTPSKPVIVKSSHQSRIVGCTGGAGEEAHELLWHEVQAGKPLVCLECGQVFELQSDAAEHHH